MTTRAEAETKALELAGLKPEEIFKPQGQVKFYIEEQPIYYDEADLWWVWNKEELKWVLSNEVDILNKIEKITGEEHLMEGLKNEAVRVYRELEKEFEVNEKVGVEE